MLRVGLTGGIATGKSRVCAQLAARGLHTIDLDRVAHVVIEPGRPAHAEILAAFGNGIRSADGQIDRRALGAIVFTHASARERLNEIVHPRIFEEETRMIEALRLGAGDVVVTDATLLVESGHHIRFDRLVVTTCDRRQQLGRLMHRDGLSAGAAQARIASQMDGAEKARHAHHVIDTSRSLSETDAAAAALADELRALATSWTGGMPVGASAALGCVLQGPTAGPRGLHPRVLVSEIAQAGIPALARLVRRLVPAVTSPWYEAGRSEVAGPGPEALMGPLVLWSRAWHGPDDEALIAAAVSLASLTHTWPEALASAASFALALAEVAGAGAIPPDLPARIEARSGLLARWTGAPPPPRILQLLRTATGAAAQSSDDDGLNLLGALRGLATGADVASAPRDLVAAVQSLRRPA